MQNIQARVRSPFIWFIANTNNMLLLSTSNRSENAVGYSTMDGDTSGSISPIAGIDKVFIKKLLIYLKEKYNYNCLNNVLNLEPSAELKPKKFNQKDEDDLMPYSILSRIEREAIKERLSPKNIYDKIKKEKICTNNELKKYTDGITPCIVGKTGTNYILLVSKEQLDMCEGKPEKLEKLITEKLIA